MNVDLTESQLVRAINHYADKLGGWIAYAEPMTGCVFFSNPEIAPSITVWATPDWESPDDRGEIVCQIDQEWETLATDLIAWPHEGRTIAGYLERIAPLLACVGLRRAFPIAGVLS